VLIAGQAGTSAGEAPGRLDRRGAGALWRHNGSVDAAPEMRYARNGAIHTQAPVVPVVPIIPPI